MIKRRRKKWSTRYTAPGKVLFPDRIKILTVFIGVLFAIIISRLFYLQILQGNKYVAKIQTQTSSETEFTPRRGDIIVKEYATGNIVKLALNTSLDELRIDAQEIPDKKLVSELLTPIIFTEDEYEKCKENIEYCPENSVIFPELAVQEDDGNKEGESEKKSELNFALNPLLPTFSEALQKKEEEIFRKVNTDNRYVLIKRQLTPEMSEHITELKRKYAREHQQDREKLYAQKKDTSLALPDYFKGVILESKQLRFYPEGKLASQIIGFLNHDGVGQYGIEGKMNNVLLGKKGKHARKTDTRGRVIELTVEDFQKAIDGSNIVLTLDRVIQKKVEEVLESAVKRFRADSGQVIVMNPKNGKILALANAPSFDPNEFGNVYLTRRTTPEDTDRIFETTPLFKKDPNDPDEGLISSSFEEYEEAWKLGFDPEFYVYENFAGPGAYLNRAVQEIYEPGSVFKPLVMAIALNENEVIPNTKYLEEKPVEVDVGGRLVPIRNADSQYLGWQTMKEALQRSSNLGMVFVARKLGKSLMHQYLEEYGFGKETYVELDEEQSGTLSYYTQWSTAALFNHAFGQGISATPLQVVTAWSAMANGGLLPEPHIIEEIYHADGTLEIIEPESTNVLKADTAQTITAMLISAVEEGVARPARIEGYRVAGKTGTSQIARTDGPGYENTSKLGSVITSFVGYAPAEHPKFVVLVKFDRPRLESTDNTWGSTTAAPIFKEVTEFLLDYYDIPPDY